MAWWEMGEKMERYKITCKNKSILLKENTAMNQFEEIVKLYKEIDTEFKYRFLELTEEIKKSLKRKLEEYNISFNDTKLNNIRLKSIFLDEIVTTLNIEKFYKNIVIEEISSFDPNPHYSDIETTAYREGFETALRFKSDIYNPYKNHANSFDLFCAWCVGYEDSTKYVINSINS